MLVQLRGMQLGGFSPQSTKELPCLHIVLQMVRSLIVGLALQRELRVLYIRKELKNYL